MVPSQSSSRTIDLKTNRLLTGAVFRHKLKRFVHSSVERSIWHSSITWQLIQLNACISLYDMVPSQSSLDHIFANKLWLLADALRLDMHFQSPSEIILLTEKLISRLPEQAKGLTKVT